MYNYIILIAKISTLLSTYFLTPFSNALAQNIKFKNDIYFSDESTFNSQLLELRPKKLKHKNANAKIEVLNTDNILFVFNSDGNFVIYPNKNLNDSLSKIFINSKVDPPGDLLLTLENKLISAKIISKNEKDITYENLQSNIGEQNISLNFLALIIYKNGQHELFVNPSQVYGLLRSQVTNIDNYRRGLPIYEKSLSLDINTIASKQPALHSKKSNSTKKSVAKNTPEIPIPPAPYILINEDSLLKEGKIKPDTLKQNQLSTEIISKKVLEKTNKLKKLIEIINDSSASQSSVNIAINEACKLFISEETRIEVYTNSENSFKVRFKIRDYFKKIRSKEYKNINIVWTNINYISNIEPLANGSCKGTITLQQKINGFIEGKLFITNPITRNDEVYFNIPESEKISISKEKWDILLSDMGIFVVTQK